MKKAQLNTIPNTTIAVLIIIMCVIIAALLLSQMRSGLTAKPSTELLSTNVTLVNGTWIAYNNDADTVSCELVSIYDYELKKYVTSEVRT